MTDAELARLKELAEKATALLPEVVDGSTYGDGARIVSRRDAELLVTGLVALIAEVERLRAELEGRK